MKFFKIISVFLIFVICLCSFSGCESFKKAYPTTVAGVEIDKVPQKVAVLSDAAASYITTLGYGSYLFGAPTSFVKNNKSNTALVDIGSPLTINEKDLLALSPDVFIVSTGLSAELTNKLNLKNIKIIKLETPKTYDEIKNYYCELIKLFVGEKEYENVKTSFFAKMDAKIESIKSANKSTDEKVVVFVEDDFVVTGDTLAGSLLSKIGVDNLAKQSLDYKMPKQDIAIANPDVIFCAKGSADAILKDEAFKEVNAIKNMQVYETDITGLLYGCDGFAALQDMVTYINK